MRQNAKVRNRMEENSAALKGCWKAKNFNNFLMGD